MLPSSSTISIEGTSYFSIVEFPFCSFDPYMCLSGLPTFTVFHAAQGNFRRFRFRVAAELIKRNPVENRFDLSHHTRPPRFVRQPERFFHHNRERRFLRQRFDVIFGVPPKVRDRFYRRGTVAAQVMLAVPRRSVGVHAVVACACSCRCRSAR